MKEFIKKVPVLGGLARCGYAFYKTEKAKSRLRCAVKNPPVKIVVGSSGVFEESWTPTDIQFLNLLDPGHWKKSFQREFHRCHLV